MIKKVIKHILKRYSVKTKLSDEPILFSEQFEEASTMIDNACKLQAKKMLEDFVDFVYEKLDEDSTNLIGALRSGKQFRIMSFRECLKIFLEENKWTI